MPATPENINNLYVQNPGAVHAAAPTPIAAPAAPQVERAVAYTPSAERAVATGYKATTQEVKPGDLASSQLNEITSLASPLMKRARQEGMLSAARRGLQNSSIAAGASMGAMVDRAAPIAQQNAQHLLTQSLTNQEAINRANEISTGRQTDVSVANMQSANQLAGLAAQLQTAVSQGNADAVNAIQRQMVDVANSVNQFNAGQAQDVNLANARADNDLMAEVVHDNAAINLQHLTGTQAIDLQTIQNANQLLISSNETAGNIWSTGMDAIARVMSDPNLDPNRATQVVQGIRDNIEAGLRLVDAMTGTDTAGAASRSQLPSTPQPPTTQYFPGNFRVP